MRKELWSPEEDEKLKQYILKHGYHTWSEVSIKAGLRRGAKSCRLRWMNYLRPGLKRCKFSSDETKLVMDLHKIYGNRWSKIARCMEGRTDNDVKNIWNSKIRRKHHIKLKNNLDHKLTIPNISLLHSISVSNHSNYSFTQEEKEEHEGIFTQHNGKKPQPIFFPFSLDFMGINVANNYGIFDQHELSPLEHSIEKLLFSKLNSSPMHSVEIDGNIQIERTPNLEVDKESTMYHIATQDNISIERFNYSWESFSLTSTSGDYDGEDGTLNHTVDSWIW